MKIAIAVLALAGFLVAQTLAAPATEIQAEADDAHISTNLDSALIEANKAVEETNERAKKSSGPKTVCFEAKDVQGTSYLQCAESVDSESEGTSLYPQYSPAPSPYGSSSGYGSSSSSYGPAPSSSYGPPPPSYKVSFK